MTAPNFKKLLKDMEKVLKKIENLKPQYSDDYMGGLSYMREYVNSGVIEAVKSGEDMSRYFRSFNTNDYLDHMLDDRLAGHAWLPKEKGGGPDFKNKKWSARDKAIYKAFEEFNAALEALAKASDPEHVARAAVSNSAAATAAASRAAKAAATRKAKKEAEKAAGEALIAAVEGKERPKRMKTRKDRQQ
jgi:hypothetical protein